MSVIQQFTEVPWTETVPALGMSAHDMFAGNQAAFDVALLLVRTCNIWDDLIDDDRKPTEAEIHYSYISLLHDLKVNPFYQQREKELFPMITSAILSWLTANEYENTQDEHGVELGHTLRYAVIQVVGYIVYLCHGFRGATEIWPPMFKAFCTERFVDYRAEIMEGAPSNARQPT